jgi:hypothetical protein
MSARNSCLPSDVCSTELKEAAVTVITLEGARAAARDVKDLVLFILI